MKYHHIHLNTDTPKEGEIYIPELDAFTTDPKSNEYGVAWKHYGPRNTFPEIIKNSPHMGFEVENIEEAVKGKKVLVQPFTCSNVKVAFIQENGAVIELLEKI